MVLAAAGRFFAAYVREAQGHEAKLRLALLHAIARNMRLYDTPIFAGVLAVLAAQWIPWWQAALWYAALIGYVTATFPLRQRIFTAQGEGTKSTRQIRRALAVMLPYHVIYIAYVPLCWIDGNVGNNTFLTVFYPISIVITTQMYGPCLYLTLPATALYLPMAFRYVFQTGTPLDPVFPVFQTMLCALIGLLALNHYRMFRASVFRRFAVEHMAAALSAARDDADRANRTKSAFLASMSHELRTPLNGIIGFSDLMLQEINGPVSPPNYRDYLTDIHASGNHLLALINDVLDLSKIEAGKRQLQNATLGLESIAFDARQFVTSQAERAGVRVAIAIAPTQQLIADERAIRQILTNLLSNAIKFSPRGGEVTVFAEAADGGLRLGVRDRGIGMDADGIEKALEPYGQVSLTTTVEGTGTGLGLPIVKALIEAHGARFHLESTPGKGTQVWGEFPPSRLPKPAQAA